MTEIGKGIIFIGIVIVVIGIILSFSDKLPGDIMYKKENASFYFPITTSIIISIILSILLYLFGKVFR